MDEPGVCRTAVCGLLDQISMLTLKKKLGSYSMCAPHSSRTRDSKITNAPQYPVSAAAWAGISQVIADLEKATDYFQNPLTESQNHRTVGVGRDLCGSSSPTLLPKQGHLQQAAPVQKPDRRWCLTVDYWCLNGNTAPLTAAVPNITNLTATLQAAASPRMVTLDVKGMFSMVPLHGKDKEKFEVT